MAYIGSGRLRPSSFAATLVAEPDNRYFPHALAVTVAGEKLGYVAPEVAESLDGPGGAFTVVCPARRGSLADHETSGVELLLDFSGCLAAVYPCARGTGCYDLFVDAGWSSPVARWAHNPKVAGSNPAPATKFQASQAPGDKM